jgi:hypothetical protein
MMLLIGKVIMAKLFSQNSLFNLLDTCNDMTSKKRATIHAIRQEFKALGSGPYSIGQMKFVLKCYKDFCDECKLWKKIQTFKS